MAEEHLIGSPGEYGSNGSSGRPEFIEFRNRVKRLVESMVSLRNVPRSEFPWMGSERVDVKLESESVMVDFFVAQLTLETAIDVIQLFHESFSKRAPLFLEGLVSEMFRLIPAHEKEGGYGLSYLKQNTTLTFHVQPLRGGYSLKIETSLSNFNDHFEVFVTDAARKLFSGRRKVCEEDAGRSRVLVQGLWTGF